MITKSIDSLRSEIRDKSVCVIDTRRSDDYKQGHIPTSVNLPLADLLADDSPQRVIEIAQSLGIHDEKPLVIYDDTFGALASRVAWTLQYVGHSNVTLLETTFAGWKKLGLEIDTNTPEMSAEKHSLNIQSDMLATSEDLESAQDVTLIDNRERLNYLEQHIPGAISLPYRTLASPDKILRPPQEMKRLFENRNITPESHIITYCGSVGTLSGLAYYALKSAGLDNVRLYVRSFKEWKSLQKPTEKQSDANYWDLSAE